MSVCDPYVLLPEANVCLVHHSSPPTDTCEICADLVTISSLDERFINRASNEVREAYPFVTYSEVGYAYTKQLRHRLELALGSRYERS